MPSMRRLFRAPKALHDKALHIKRLSLPIRLIIRPAECSGSLTAFEGPHGLNKAFRPHGLIMLSLEGIHVKECGPIEPMLLAVKKYNATHA